VRATGRSAPGGADPSAAAPEGVLVVDKPAGPTSFDVVARVRRLLRAEKAGHTGTLDPLATGVLAVCVGAAVKLQQFLSEGDKTYLATFAFGAATTTEDAQGEVVERGDASGLDEERVRATLARFVGTLSQVPPMYSAVRVAGERLHEAARAGRHVERAPRTVHVRALELIALERAGTSVHALVRVRCGKGTYVRTLAADAGRALGIPAHLAALRRTEAGPFGLADAIPLAEAETLAAHEPTALLRRLVPLAEALRGWPSVQLSPSQAREMAHGHPVETGAVEVVGLCRALDPDGRLLAVCEGRGASLRPLRVLAGPPPRALVR
jgi:tRNA pseudouridine55 synthase